MTATIYSPWMYYMRLIAVMASRDVMAQFKDAVLGIFWLVLRPVLFMITFSIVRGIINFPTDGIPYPLTSFVAIAAWLLFVSILQGTTPSIVRNGGIIKKMAVPRIIFPISGVAISLVEYAVSWIPLAFLLLYYGWPVGVNILFVPFLALLTVALGLGLGLLIASISVYKKDLTLALPYIAQFWMFLCPIIYPLSRVPEEYRSLYIWNPMVGVIENFRIVVLRDMPPDWSLLMPTFVVLVMVWVVAIPVFRFFSRYFADVL